MKMFFSTNVIGVAMFPTHTHTTHTHTQTHAHTYFTRTHILHTHTHTTHTHTTHTCTHTHTNTCTHTHTNTQLNLYTVVSYSGINEIVDHGFKADLAVGDEAPDITGQHDLNEFVQAHLLLALSDHQYTYHRGGPIPKCSKLLFCFSFCSSSMIPGE